MTDSQTTEASSNDTGTNTGTAEERSTVHGDPALQHLELHLARLRALVEHAYGGAAQDAHIDASRQLSRFETTADAGNETLPILELTQRFGLSEAELDIVLLAAAPALDVEWRTLVEKHARYGVLDVAFAVGLLAAQQAHPLKALQLFDRSGPLRTYDLVQVFTLGRADENQLLNYRLQTPMRVAMALTGREMLDESLQTIASLGRPEVTLNDIIVGREPASALVGQIRKWRQEPASGRALAVHVRGPSGVGKSRVSHAIAWELGLPVLEVDAALLASRDPATAADLVDELFRAAAFLDALLIIDQVDVMLGGGPALAVLRRNLENTPIAVALLGVAELPESSGLGWRSLAEIRLEAPDNEARERIWKTELTELAVADDLELGLLASQYPLTGAQISNAALDANLRLEGDDLLTQDGLGTTSSLQLRADLSEFARPRNTRLTLDDLVLPPGEKEAIHEIISACRQRAAVLHRWGFGKRLDYGTGIVSMFSGEPGTGKTLSARIIAEAVGMNLYQIAIPSIVSKWIGETEQNISKIFHRARASQAILLFDEADSLLASRTEVKDSTDRYANMSTNQLLQEIEAFEGIVILTTNLEQNLDAAAERRILFRVHFPYPGVAEREELWQRLIPPEALPEDADIDFEGLAELYELSGGHIKNAILRGAYAAMERGVGLNTEVLGAAAEKECRAIGKLVRHDW